MTEILNKTELFEGIDKNDIDSILKCLKVSFNKYYKGDFIFLAGKSKPMVSILISGKAQIIKETASGDSMLINEVYPGNLFCETFASMDLNIIPLSVVATEVSEVIMFDIYKIIHTCTSACSFHQNLIFNLLKIMAKKNIFLNQKMSYITHKTIRNRLLSYFYDEIEKFNSSYFTIPFNRYELADYLCVDRSALCRELSNMKKEKIIDYKGKNFHYLL